MTQCARCAREIPESAAVCDHCGYRAGDDPAVPLRDADGGGQAPAPAIETVAAVPAKAGVSRRELLAFLAVALVAGVVTVALLLARGASSTELRAASSLVPAPTAPAVTPPPSAPVSRWNSEHRAEWLGTQRNSAAFEVPADEPVAVWLARVRPIVVVRCVSKSLQAFVFTGSAIKIEPQTQDHTVSFGFDDGQAVTERWPDSAEHDALFAPDGVAFAERLTRAHTLQFGYTPHNAAPVIARFHVSGLSDLLVPAAKECGWPTK